MRNEFVKAIQNNKYEIANEGIFIPSAKVYIGGVFKSWITRDGEIVSDIAEDHNLVVDEGLNYILNSAFNGLTAQTTQYIGIYGNNYTPLAGSINSSATASNNFVDASKAGEITTAYNESVRPTWVDATSTAKSLTNSASPAVFTANTNVTVYGAFLVQGTGANTKGSYGTAQTLIAASLFSSARALVSTDILNVTYALSITSS